METHSAKIVSYQGEPMQLELIVDSHETKKIPYLERYLNSVNGKYRIKSFTVDTLDSGDYITNDGAVGIERKSKHDFLSSLYSNLSQQLIELRNNFKYPYLLIEFDGIRQIAEFYNVDYKYIIGAMASFTAHYHITPICCGPFFFDTMFKIIEKHYDGKDIDIQSTYSPIRRVATKQEYKINLIASAYHGLGISDTLAKRLLTRFGSPQAIFNATSSQLQVVKGIGKKKAKKMVNVIKNE